MNQQPNWIYDGSLSFEGGVDGGKPPALLPDFQVSRARNTTMRGGHPHPRPNEVLRVTIDDPGMFQSAGGYTSVDGRGYLFLAVEGVFYRVSIENWTVSEPVLPDAGNNPDRRHGWFTQAEEFLIYQDGRSRPLIWDGVRLRRAGYKEVPTGGPMAYGIGRLWVARGKEYLGGDLIHSDPRIGTASLLRFTENDYLNEGGAFRVPWQAGDITGLSFTARQDTATGEGSLMVLTRPGMFEFAAPVDRDAWKSIQQPIQRFALLKAGATSQQSIVQVNGDLFFRAVDGVRSFYFALREFNQWGNTPISREVEPIMARDDADLLSWASAINFDNRYLLAADPVLTPNGTEHRRLVVMDFDLASSLRQKLPAAWEGEWFSGWRILQLVEVEHMGKPRAFIIARNEQDGIAIYELGGTNTARAQTRWEFETKGYQFQQPLAKKRLETAYIWLEEIRGPASMQVWYRSDQRESWVPWARWAGGPSGCMTFDECGMPLAASPLDIASPITLPTPRAGSHCVMQRDGYEFQLLIRIYGQAKLKKLILAASDRIEAPFFNLTKNCTPLEEPSICTSLPTGRIVRVRVTGVSTVGVAVKRLRHASASLAAALRITAAGWVQAGEGGDPEEVHWPDPPPEPPPAPPGYHVVPFSSYYGFGLGPEVDPNGNLTADQIAHAKCLLASELAAYPAIPAGGYWWSPQNWSEQGDFPAVDRKEGCDYLTPDPPNILIGGSTATHLTRWAYAPD